MTIDKTIAAAMPDDPNGSWAAFWAALMREYDDLSQELAHMPPIAAAGHPSCEACWGKGYVLRGYSAYECCDCETGQRLRAGIRPAR